MKRIWGVVFGVTAMIWVGALPASADERKFTYSYEAKTLPAGTVELEQWATVRARKESGEFRQWKMREELEYGFTDRFTGALYMNWEVETVHDVPGRVDEREAKFEGVSLEGKYKLTDPSADLLGTLLYAELSAETDEYEFELKGIVSKSFGDWTFAYNAVFEVEWAGARDAAGIKRWSHEYQVQNTAGVSLHLLPALAVGVEAMTRTPYTEDLKDRLETVYFIGPNVHVTTGPIWATLTLLAQVDPQGHNDLDLNGFTKYEVRLIFGINF